MTINSEMVTGKYISLTPEAICAKPSKQPIQPTCQMTGNQDPRLWVQSLAMPGIFNSGLQENQQGTLSQGNSSLK